MARNLATSFILYGLVTAAPPREPKVYNKIHTESIHTNAQDQFRTNRDLETDFEASLLLDLDASIENLVELKATELLEKKFELLLESKLDEPSSDRQKRSIHPLVTGLEAETQDSKPYQMPNHQAYSENVSKNLENEDEEHSFFHAPSQSVNQNSPTQTGYRSYNKQSNSDTADDFWETFMPELIRSNPYETISKSVSDTYHSVNQQLNQMLDSSVNTFKQLASEVTVNDVKSALHDVSTQMAEVPIINIPLPEKNIFDLFSGHQKSQQNLQQHMNDAIHHDYSSNNAGYVHHSQPEPNTLSHVPVRVASKQDDSEHVINPDLVFQGYQEYIPQQFVYETSDWGHASSQEQDSNMHLYELLHLQQESLENDTPYNHKPMAAIQENDHENSWQKEWPMPSTDNSLPTTQPPSIQFPLELVPMVEKFKKLGDPISESGLLQGREMLNHFEVEADGNYKMTVILYGNEPLTLRNVVAGKCGRFSPGLNILREESKEVHMEIDMGLCQLECDFEEHKLENTAEILSRPIDVYFDVTEANGMLKDNGYLAASYKISPHMNIAEDYIIEFTTEDRHVHQLYTDEAGMLQDSRPDEHLQFTYRVILGKI